VRKHGKIVEYALSSLLRRKHRNLAILAASTLVVAILASILFLTGALRTEARNLLGGSADLIVQRLSAGRHDLIPVAHAETIRGIPGVGTVRPRYWGYYYDPLTKSNYTLLGAGGATGRLDLLRGRMPARRGECAVGAGVSEARFAGEGGELILTDSRNMGVSFRVVGVFRSESRMLTNDLVVLTDDGLIAFFGMPEGKATDIQAEVRNGDEVQTVARKVKRLLPDTRPITKRELLRTYDMAFHWRSGMMLTVFAAAVIAFCILAWDKATGISAEERQEIGILKAIGWDTSDVLALKFWEGLILSMTAFFLGAVAGFVHVFFLGATVLGRILQGWSVLFPEFRLSPHVDPYQLLVLAFLTITPYVASTVVPSWKAAVTDPESVMRG
jgi:hypothetical protein